ncbi:MAG: GGDEF domain-containing protein [Elusimicrobia bacterium]|nr:GGDEF domain-containing protein [Elusimicrobiota bacterium]
MKNYFALLPLLSLTLLVLPFQGKGRRGLLAAFVLAVTAVFLGIHLEMTHIGILYAILFVGVGLYQFPLKQEVHTAVKRSFNRQISSQTDVSSCESECNQWENTRRRLSQELDQIAERYSFARSLVTHMEESPILKDLSSLFSQESAIVGFTFARLLNRTPAAPGGSDGLAVIEEKCWEPTFVSGSLKEEEWKGILRTVPMTLNRPRDRYLSSFIPETGWAQSLPTQAVEGYTILGQPVRWQGRLQGLLGFLLKNPHPKEISDKIVSSAQILGLGFHKISLYRLTLERSRRDSLTDLYLRRIFLERLQEEVNFSKRYGTSFSILILDLDHFKSVNDTYGHPTGDQVLKEVAKTMQSVLDPGVTIARYGGEEFSILIGLAPCEEVIETAEKIRKSVEETNVKGPQGEKVKVTASLGVAHYLPESPSPEELIRRADSALYKAKQSGRNQVCEWCGNRDSARK